MVETKSTSRGGRKERSRQDDPCNYPTIEKRKCTVVDVRRDDVENRRRRDGRRKKRKRGAYRVLTEREIGIYEFLRDDSVRGVGGHLRIRCSDFRVDEIRREGTMVCAPRRVAQRTYASAREAAAATRTDDDSYLRFNLTKAKVSTVNAVKTLSQFLDVRPASITFAGLKDAKAITTQEVTIADPPVRKLDELDMNNIRLDRFVYVSRPLIPGILSGNRFQIIVRGGTSTHRCVNELVASISRRGFVNYYGMQRFSGTATRNEQVAKWYLRKQYAAAVDAVLGVPPWGCASDAEASARSAWVDARDANTALRMMPKHFHFERQILVGLQRAIEYDRRDDKRSVPTFENRCRTAFLSTPFPDRLLCVNAYFSRLWNKAASERIRMNRTGAIVGDLVVKENFDNRCRALDNVRCLEQDDKGVALSDVLLPLPGSDVNYPSHAVGAFMRQYLRYEGITSDCFELEKSVDASDVHIIRGTYRPIVRRPIDGVLQWQPVTYDKIAKPVFPVWDNVATTASSIFATSDKQQRVVRALADAVECREITTRVTSTLTEQRVESFFDSFDAKDGPYVAMCFRFALPPGTYATSMLRELMNGSSSSKGSFKRHIKFDD